MGGSYEKIVIKTEDIIGLCSYGISYNRRLLGNLANYIAGGMDSGFESFGWLLMYLVCAMSLTKE
ncbi:MULTISPECIES: hypothetical protein [Pseudobutyrivibrio]|uniref:hypothetical protein n=1 Tax=Pseudobutyrivibrio TaxID=46205 RepID=UPI0003F7C4F6|nr:MULTISPECIES: hypothetical protein [Pseudobutyrivibrio]MDC7279503.1 hypothetical protein [Butyrivibrio fibrisolvens]